MACRLAAVRTNLVADASSGTQPLVQHLNAQGDTVATSGGEEGDDGGPNGGSANAGTCDPKYWSCPGAAGYKVRSQTYLKVCLPCCWLHDQQPLRMTAAPPLLTPPLPFLASVLGVVSSQTH